MNDTVREKLTKAARAYQATRDYEDAKMAALKRFNPIDDDHPTMDGSVARIMEEALKGAARSIEVDIESDEFAKTWLVACNVVSKILSQLEHAQHAGGGHHDLNFKNAALMFALAGLWPHTKKVGIDMGDPPKLDRKTAKQDRVPGQYL